MKKSGSKQGFTIIEVVLVLAIAGLIFLMVFVALPALQRSQRDSQRRQDAARVATALTNYMANNGGSLPSENSTSECRPGSADPNVGNRSDMINPSDSNTYDGASIPVACKIIARYLNGSDDVTNSFKDPDGVTYGLIISRMNTIRKPSGFDYNFYVSRKSKCDGDEAIKTGNMNEFSVVYKLEGAGTVCVDNQ